MPEEEVDFYSDIRTSILNQTPRGGRAILWSSLLLVVIGLVWAYFSEIEEVTRGEGKVIPSGHIQVVQNLEGGIISEIMVNVGDLVQKGQLLLRIDETRFSASYLENRGKYLTFKARAARLEAETKGANFVVPVEVAREKPEIGSREQELHESRKKQFATRLGILQEQVTQRVQELKELKVKREELSRTYKLLQKELELTRPLLAQGAASEVELLHLERQASQMHGEIETIKLAIPRAESKRKEANWALREANLNFSNKAKGELNEVLAMLEGLSASSVALEDRLKRTAVRSPVNGTVNQILVNTVGGVIQPGMDLIEIVPLEDSLLVEAGIKPADIAFLRPKQQAMVKFSAYDFTIYGGLEAELEHISADSITDEQGNSYYLVKLRTRKNYIGTESKPLPIIPGMVATVDILTGKKTILTYLLKPILRARHMALRER
jgi:adhesin transport system membrane fusion protein